MTKKNYLSLVSLLAISILDAGGAEMPAVIERPGADDGPTRVSIGIWMVDITSIDSAQQSFTTPFGRRPRMGISGQSPRVSLLRQDF